MLERAKGCFEQGRRQILRLPRDQAKARHLRSGFWTHGAGQIDLSTWWLTLLSPAPCQADRRDTAARRARSNLAAGFNGDGFLDFLYPAKALELLRKVAARDALRRKNMLQRQKTAGGLRFYTRRRPRIASEEHMTNRNGSRLLSGDEDAISSANSPTRRHEEQELEEEEKKEEADHLKSRTAWYIIGGGTDNVPAPARSERNRSLDRIAGNDRRFIYLRRRHHELTTHFEDYMRKFERSQVDPAAEAEVTSNALREAKELYSVGSELLERTASLVSSYLERNKEASDWTESDWKVQMYALGRRRGWDDKCGQIFEKALKSGKVTLVLPTLTATIMNEDSTMTDGGFKIWKYHDIYESWRNSLEDGIRSNTAPFWDYLIENQDVQTLRMVRQLDRLVNDDLFRKKFPAESPSLHSIRDLFKAVLRKPGFGELDNYHLRRFYLRLRGILMFSSDYETLHEFLKLTIFLETSQNRHLHGEQAFKIFQIMNRFEGYRGETAGGPDLARKLFWRLCRTNMVKEAFRVFENIQQRKKDWAMEYGVLSFQLSQAGLRKEWEKLQVWYKQFPERWKQSRVGERSKLEIYRDQIDLHRRRNELKDCIDVFQAMAADVEVEPDIHAYNLMISAHARVSDLDGAQEWFKKLLLAGTQPDFHSYVPFLRAFAYRGDVNRVRAITREIEGRGIVTSDILIRSHLIALLQAGALYDARNLVQRSSNFLVDDRTKLWDLLIGAFALRGDRKMVNDLLLAMRRSGLPPSPTTYGHRLRLWCSRRQPDKAEHVIRKVMKPAGIQPTAFHYAVIMKGYNDIQNPLKALEIFNEMTRSNVKPDWSAKQMLSRALVKAKRQGANDKIPLTRWKNYEKVAGDISPSDLAADGSILTVATDSVDELYPSAYFHLNVNLTLRGDDVHKAKGGWDAFMDLMRERESDGPDFLPPISVVTRLLSSYRRHEMWPSVEWCWGTIVKRAEQLGKPPKGDQIAFSRRYVLCQPLNSYMKALLRQGLFRTKLPSVIHSLLKKGFRLDGRCWNQYVRGLIREEPQGSLLAFETAEATIMSGWQGWPRLDNKADEGSRRSLRQKMLFYASKHSRKRTQADVPPAHLISAVLDDQPGVTEEGQKAGRSAPSEPYAVSDGDLGPDDGVYDPQSRDNNTTTGLSKDGDQEGRGPTGNGRLDSDQMPVSSSGSLNDTELVLIEEQYGPAGHRVRRPEYSTLVYLTRAFLDLRLSAVYEDKARDTIRQLSRVAPTVLQAILTMPRVDDELQLSMLRR